MVQWNSFIAITLCKALTWITTECYMYVYMYIIQWNISITDTLRTT